MRFGTSLESVNAEVDKNKLIIMSKRPLDVLSSAVLNGGFTEANIITNIHVTEDRDQEIHKDPEGFLRKTVVKLGLDPEKVVGIMTAADLQKVEVIQEQYQNITLSVFVTAGVNTSATAGEATVSKPDFPNINKTGTINIILLIDGNLTESCMVDAVKTITEAKTVALRELDVRSYFSGDLASGTVTDSVVVACTKRGQLIKYAGTATLLGELIGKSVKKSVKKAIQKQKNRRANRPLEQRLDERGISLAKSITVFSEIRPKIRESSEKFRQFRKKVKQVLSDPNMASLVIAGLRLDDDSKNDLIPVGVCDKSRVCGTLQAAVMNYMYGDNVNLRYLKLDNMNLAAVDNLGSFAGSILATIMDCVYSDLFGKP